MLRTLKDDDARLSLLGQYLEGIQFTVFRQTQFAEFELRLAGASYEEVARAGGGIVSTMRATRLTSCSGRPAAMISAIDWSRSM